MSVFKKIFDGARSAADTLSRAPEQKTWPAPDTATLPTAPPAPPPPTTTPPPAGSADPPPPPAVAPSTGAQGGAQDPVRRSDGLVLLGGKKKLRVVGENFNQKELGKIAGRNHDGATIVPITAVLNPERATRMTPTLSAFSSEGKTSVI